MNPPEERPGSERGQSWRSISGLTLVLGLGFVLVAVLLWPRQVRDPRYGALTLSQWLARAYPDATLPDDLYGHIHDELRDRLLSPDVESAEDTIPSQPLAPESVPPAVEAVQHLGTNALPQLLEMLTSRPRPADLLANRLGLLLRWPRLANLAWERAETRRVRAWQGFVILGPTAQPALPALSNLLHQPNPDMTVALAITAVGPEGVAVVTHALRDPDPDVRDTAALALGLSGGWATSAIPTLAALVDAGAASYHVLGAIGRIGGQPECVVPALTRFLQREPDEFESEMAAVILGLYGEAAGSAALVLRSIWAEAEPQKRALLREVLRRIEPGASPERAAPTP